MIVVVPFAKTDTNIIFSVAPTLGKSKLISFGFISSASHIILPKFLLMVTPNFSKPFKCKSIGLEPMSHPPVCDSLWVHKF